MDFPVKTKLMLLISLFSNLNRDQSVLLVSPVLEHLSLIFELHNRENVVECK